MAGDLLADACVVVMGQSPPGSSCNTQGKGLPLLNGPTEYGPHHPAPVQFTTDARKRAKPGDVLFCVRGSTTGRMNWADQEYAIGRGVAAVRHKHDPSLQPFVRAVIEYSLPGLLAQATGSTFPNVSADQLSGLWWPPLEVPEQRAIAHILGTLDDKIELNRRMSETLEAMARALFQSWFVDFDPVRAKAEGRDPGLPQPLADLFPARLVDSELGEIPEGWKVRRVGDLSDIDKGLSYKGEGLADEGGLPMVNLGCFAGGGAFKAENLKRYRGAFKDRHLVGPGDLLVANTDMTQNRVILGSPALLPELGGEKRFLFTHHTFVFRFKPGAERWRRFLYFTLLQPGFREIAEGFATGTTVLALPRDGLLTLSLVLPPGPVLAAFDRQVDAILAAVNIRGEQSRTLAACRDSLLPKLISGELRVESSREARGHDY
jgi:type I restriction enzyme S subunit